MSLEDIPKKVQYLTIDSNFVTGTNNTFSLDLQLESNTHVEDMSRVLGIKMVDFYITQVGFAGGSTHGFNSTPTNIPKYVDIVCPDIPKVAQILDERNGQILARIPLERHFTTAFDSSILRDKQWKRFNQKTNYFNPISIQKLNFQIFEEQDDGDYVTLNPDSKWYMILEITTVDVKEKPRERDLQQILTALNRLVDRVEPKTPLGEPSISIPEDVGDSYKWKEYISIGVIVLSGIILLSLMKRRPKLSE